MNYYYYQSKTSGVIVRTDNPKNDDETYFGGDLILCKPSETAEFQYTVGDRTEGWLTSSFTQLSDDEIKNLCIIDKKKYTVIYSEFFQIGSHRNSIVKIEYIECEPEKLMETIESKDIDMGSVNFILDGHCVQSED